MWSHYGDQHKGLCIGYTIPKRERQNLRKVEYGGSRLVKASLIKRMLAGDADASRAVDEAVLLRKAEAWEYEAEWRLFGARGSQQSPLEMSSITFGMRCDSAVQHAIISALRERDKPVKFFQIEEQPGLFDFRRKTIHPDELAIDYPIRALSALEGFDDVGS